MNLYRIKADTEITLELIQEFAAKHVQDVNKLYKPLLDAYMTDYEIFKQPCKPAHKPDNRLAVNFAKYITDTMVGFFSGIPVKITSTDETVNSFVDLFNALTVIDDLFAEEVKTACIYGFGYEIAYNNERGEQGIIDVSPMDGFMLYDDSVLKRKRAFVRLYYEESSKKTVGSVSTDKYIRYFELRPNLHWTSEEKLHGFNGVPVSVYELNKEHVGIFQPVMSLINEFNEAISAKANDVDAFADAYMKVLGAKLDVDELKHIRDDRIINFDGADTDKLVVDFMDRPDGDTTQEHLLDRLSDLIFKVSMVADISDENFGGSSGIALKYKMQAMSNLAKTMERKFKAAMQERYRLIFSSPANSMREEDYARIDYQFTLNYPANVLEESQIAGNLAGITSKETQLKVLSIIDNVKEERERIDEEQDLTSYSTDYPTARTNEDE